MTATSGESGGTDVPAGDFPFRISDGAEESRYLTWLRNHSSYMAVRGLFDYFRAISLLLRGAFVNLLVGLPHLLLLAIAVALFHVQLTFSPFFLTLGLLSIAAGLFVLFPTQTFLTKIRRYRRTVETGAESSVKERDAVERRAGKVLVALLGVAAFEGLSHTLEPFHAWVAAHGYGASQLASVTGALMTAFGFAEKLLSKLPGAVSRRIAGVALGALGVIVPALIVLYFADFLVFSPPPEAGDKWVVVTAWCLPALILLVLVTGSLSRAFSGRDVLIVGAMLGASVVMALSTLKLGDAYVNTFAAADKALQESKAGAPQTDLAKRATEVSELAAKLAEQSGSRLHELRTLIHAAARRRSERLLGGHPERMPEARRDVRGQLGDDLDYLTDASFSYSVEGLKESVQAIRGHVAKHGDSNLAELGAAVARLRKRVAVLGELFEPEGPALGSYILDLDPAKLAFLHGRAPAKELIAFKPFRDTGDAELKKICGGAYYRVVFHLMDWSDQLKSARGEITASAMYAQEYETLYYIATSARETALWAKSALLLTVALLLLLFCWLTVDVNLTSIHGLYRDRLASAFLVGLDTKGDIDIEDDLDLDELCCHEAGSTAPYHLINVALNLQGSRDIALRDRRSDFFVFSKRFIGGKRTGYCRSEAMERVFPQMSLATAMAISAAAAAPNMGRATSPALVALMTLLNIRLGIWVPNPGLLAGERDGASRRSKVAARQRGLTFEQVFVEELEQVERRWAELGAPGRQLAPERAPTVQHGLVGLAFSGGGIRSATVNLGLAQALDRRGVFQHFDYMSTVSGGGYLGSSISALMRSRRRTVADVAGRVSLRREDQHVVVQITPDPVRRVQATRGGSAEQGEQTGPREYRYAKDALLAVADGDRVQAGQRLLARRGQQGPRPSFFGELFRWQVPPRALLWEMLGALDEDKRWVNLSDGGHIENLATLELLRRHCRFIVIGDAEADPEHRFGGLSTLIRTARIDLGIGIDIDVDALRLDAGGRTRGHWAVGRIRYPGEHAHGELLYLKSSLSGDEDEVIREYRHGSPSFPHESTADQMFGEGQFEAYRSLGQHIGEAALAHLQPAQPEAGPATFADLERWFQTLHAVQRGTAADEHRPVTASGPAPRAAYG